MNKPKNKYQLGFEHIKNIKNINSIIQEYIKNTYTIQEHHSPPSPSSDGEEDATAFSTTATAATGSRYCPMEKGEGARDSLPLPPLPPDRRREGAAATASHPTRSGGGEGAGAAATAPPIDNPPTRFWWRGGRAGQLPPVVPRPCQRQGHGDLHPRAADASFASPMSPSSSCIAAQRRHRGNLHRCQPHLLARTAPCSVVAACAAQPQPRQCRRQRTNSACASVVRRCRGFLPRSSGVGHLRPPATAVAPLASTVRRRSGPLPARSVPGWARFTTGVSRSVAPSPRRPPWHGLMTGMRRSASHTEGELRRRDVLPAATFPAGRAVSGGGLRRRQDS